MPSINPFPIPPPLPRQRHLFLDQQIANGAVRPRAWHWPWVAREVSGKFCKFSHGVAAEGSPALMKVK